MSSGRETTPEHWDKLWSKSNLAYNEKIVEIVSQRFNIEGLRILEVGAGSGSTGLQFAGMGADVTMLDYSPNALQLIRKNNSERLHVKLIEGDAFALPFKSNAFDLVYSQGLIEHFRRPEKIILEQRRATRDSVLVDVPQSFNLYTLKKKLLMLFNRWFAGWERYYTIGQLARLAEVCGLQVTGRYAYGHMHNLHRIQMRLFKKRVFPAPVVKAYGRIWHFVENLKVSRYLLFAILVLARKGHSQSD